MTPEEYLDKLRERVARLPADQQAALELLKAAVEARQAETDAAFPQQEAIAAALGMSERVRARHAFQAIEYLLTREPENQAGHDH